MPSFSHSLCPSPRIPRSVTEAIGGFLSGLLLAGTSVGSMSSPLPIAIAANLCAPGSVSVLIGSILSYLFAGSLLDNLPLLFALVLVTCLRICKRPPRTAGGLAWSTGLCVFLSGIGVALLFHGSGAEVMGYTLTAALTGCASYFMFAVFDSLRATGKIPLRASDGCAASVVLILLMAAVSSYGVPAMNAGCVASAGLTLIGARKFRCAGGVICGALSVCGVVLGAGEVGLPMLVLPVSGLFVGYLAGKNRFLIGSVFFLFSIMALVTFGTSLFYASTVLELFLGSVAFLFLDALCLDKWLVTDLSDSDTSMQPLTAKLGHMANAIRSVREDTDAIAGLLPQVEIGDVKRDVCQTVCGSCRNKLLCWESHYDNTLESFRKLEQNPDVMPVELTHCLRKERLWELFHHHEVQKRQAKFLAARTTETRTMLLEQLAAAEEILSAAGNSLRFRYSCELSDLVRRKMFHYGYPCREAAAFYTNADRLMIELTCPKGALDGSMPTVRHILSEAMNFTLEELDPLYDGELMRYRLCQRPKFRLEHFSAGRHAYQENISGDASLIFHDDAGNPCIVLSDGMGTGAHAAVESRMATEMFRKFLSGGIQSSAAVRMMNGLLLTKSPEESFATLDVAQFSLDDGALTILKSGAAATLIRHGGKVSRISATTFPLGACPEGESAVRSVRLMPDDVILMLSDGVSEEAYPMIRNLLEHSSDLEQIVTRICDDAQIFAGGDCRDDITVCAARLVSAALR